MQLVHASSIMYGVVQGIRETIRDPRLLGVEVHLVVRPHTENVWHRLQTFNVVGVSLDVGPSEDAAVKGFNHGYAISGCETVSSVDTTLSLTSETRRASCPNLLHRGLCMSVWCTS